MKNFFILSFFLLMTSVQILQADITISTTFVLDRQAQKNLQALVRNNAQAALLWQNLRKKLPLHLQDQPDPPRVIHYEGMLDTHPDRIRSSEQLLDMNVIADLLFGYYVTGNESYKEQLKNFIVAWAQTYQPTGNPINENKLIPLIHAYTELKHDFKPETKELVDKWLHEIAFQEMSNDNVPVNNWEAKRIKLVHSIAVATGEQKYADFASQHFKSYLDHSLYPDGTSNDLKHRDALHYHLSGLDPLLSYGIMLDQFGPQDMNVYRYQAEDGASIRKSIDYVVPYAKGEKTRKEWVNSRVKLDQERAKAGLEQYQPGKLFEPAESLDTFTLAYYFNEAYLPVVEQLSPKNEAGDCIYGWDLVLVMALRNS